MASRRNNIISLNWVFNEYSKSISLASLNQSIGIVYEDLEYDEDPHLHCMEPTQHSWNLDPNYIKVQVVMVRIATWPSPWSHPVRLQIHHLASREPTPLHPGKWSLCALWAYLLGFVNRMARIGNWQATVIPPWTKPRRSGARHLPYMEVVEVAMRWHH